MSKSDKARKGSDDTSQASEEEHASADAPSDGEADSNSEAASTAKGKGASRAAADAGRERKAQQGEAEAAASGHGDTDTDSEGGPDAEGDTDVAVDGDADSVDADGDDEQAATDEAFEAIVDGVEFETVDGATHASVVQERDEYLAALQRLKAEFDNHRRRATEQQTAQREQAAASLVEKLLPVLDAFDAAEAHNLEEVRPIRQQFLDALTSSGLGRLHPEGETFDPEQHEAVMHEPGDEAEPQVSEVLRTGYAWNGRVLRPAMVKVRG